MEYFERVSAASAFRVHCEIDHCRRRCTTNRRLGILVHGVADWPRGRLNLQDCLRVWAFTWICRVLEGNDINGTTLLANLLESNYGN